MFFIISKLLVFLTKPLNWAVGLLLVSFFLKTKKLGHRCRVAAAGVLVFFSNPLIINELALHWEAPPRQISEIRDTMDVAIILGGYYGADEQASDGLPQFSSAVNRFISPYQLYKMGLVRKFLLTGGGVNIFGKKSVGEAVLVHDMLRQMGVPESDILVENESRNTRENALFSKKMLDEKAPGAKCLLITSAFHMPRAMRCFDKVGQKYRPFPVDFLGKPFQWKPSLIFEPDEKAFDKWGNIIKEWVGLVAYKMKGFI